MNTVLRTENLNKKYNTLQAVSNLSLRVDKGQAFGIIGPNGSGKTTLLSMITGITTPTSGNIYWFDNQHPHQSMNKVGAIIESPAFYPYMSGQRNLELSACLRKKGSDRIDTVLEQMGLTKFRHYKYKTYSLGMKQRLAIASSLLHNPEVLIFDEPTNGLDPMGINTVRTIIKHIIASGKTVIMASHLLDEVEKICSHFALLNCGTLVHSGPIKGIRQENEEVEIGVDQEDITHILNRFRGTQSIAREGKYHIVRLKTDAKVDDLNRFLVEHNVIVTHLIVRKKTLEEEFIDVLQKTK